MIKLTKKGFITVEWDGKKKDYVEEPLEKGNFLRWANDELEFDEGVNVGDLMEAIAGLDELFIFFLSELARCDVKAFIEECRQTPDKPVTDFNYVTFSPLAVIEEWSEEKDFHFRIDVGAIGPPDEEAIKNGWKADEDINWSISFLKLSNFKHVPLKVEPLVFGREGRKEKYWEEIEKGIVYQPTLLQICKEFLWEISFYGSPEKRSEEDAKIRGIMKEIEDGTAELIPAEDVFKRLEDAIEDADE